MEATQTAGPQAQDSRTNTTAKCGSQQCAQVALLQPQPDEAAPVSLLERFVLSQKEDPFCTAVVSTMAAKDAPEHGPPTKIAQQYAMHCTVLNDLLYFVEATGYSESRRLTLKLVVPQSLVPDILHHNHDAPTAGHLGFSRTYARLRDRFIWPNMLRDIKDYVSSCSSCQRRKDPKGAAAGELQPISPGDIFETVGIDFVGPMKTTKRGNRYILVLSEYSTKWVEAFPTKDCDALTVARILVEDIICRFGAPRRLLSDRGAAFLGHVVRAACALLDVKKVSTSAYHPETDGLTERFNGTLTTMLSHYTSENQDDWDVHVPYVLYAYRTSKHSATGETPFRLIFGREARAPSDVEIRTALEQFDTQRHSLPAREYARMLATRLLEARRLASEAIVRSQAKYKETYDAEHRRDEYILGQRVWVHNPHVGKGKTRKLAKQWHGPYVVVRQLTPVTYVVAEPDHLAKESSVHISRLKPCVERLSEVVAAEHDDNSSDDDDR
jgi:transposase InsO family protein